MYIKCGWDKWHYNKKKVLNVGWIILEWNENKICRSNFLEYRYIRILFYLWQWLGIMIIYKVFSKYILINVGIRNKKVI